MHSVPLTSKVLCSKTKYMLATSGYPSGCVGQRQSASQSPGPGREGYSSTEHTGQPPLPSLKADYSLFSPISGKDRWLHGKAFASCFPVREENSGSLKDHPFHDISLFFVVDSSRHTVWTTWKPLGTPNHCHDHYHQHEFVIVGISHQAIKPSSSSSVHFPRVF